MKSRIAGDPKRIAVIGVTFVTLFVTILFLDHFAVIGILTLAQNQNNALLIYRRSTDRAGHPPYTAMNLRIDQIHSRADDSIAAYQEWFYQGDSSCRLTRTVRTRYDTQGSRLAEGIRRLHRRYGEETVSTVRLDPPQAQAELGSIRVLIDTAGQLAQRYGSRVKTDCRVTADGNVEVYFGLSDAELCLDGLEDINYQKLEMRQTCEIFATVAPDSTLLQLHLNVTSFTRDQANQDALYYIVEFM